MNTLTFRNPWQFTRKILWRSKHCKVGWAMIVICIVVMFFYCCKNVVIFASMLYILNHQLASCLMDIKRTSSNQNVRSRQDRTAILGGIISSIWAEFGQKNPSMVPHPPLYEAMPLFFRSFYAYFLPKMEPHPCFSAHISGISAEFGQKNLSMVPHLLFFRPHVYGFHLFSAYFSHIFHLFSIYFPSIFRSFCAGPVLQGRILLVLPSFHLYIIIAVHNEMFSHL